MKFEIISNKRDAKNLFEEFSPRKTPYDEWEYRSAFHAPTNFPLLFLAGYKNGVAVGVLPLQQNMKTDCIEFFGGGFMEYNSVFINPHFKEHALDFYKECINMGKPLALRDMTDCSFELPGYEHYDDTYTLDLQKYANMDDFFGEEFSSKSRSNLRKKIRKIEENSIDILENNFDDIDLMMDYNRKRFGSESSFEDKNQRKTFHNLLNLPWKWVMQTFIVNGSKEAVSLSLAYKKIFVYIMAGSNIKEVPNIGSYVAFKAIEKAFESNMHTFDAGRNVSGWKDRWHLNPIPVYRILRK